MAYMRPEEVLHRVFTATVFRDPYEVREVVTQFEEQLADFATDTHEQELGYILGNQRVWMAATKVRSEFATNEHLYAEVRRDTASGRWTFSYPMANEQDRTPVRKVEYAHHSRQSALAAAIICGFTDVLRYVEPIPDLNHEDLPDGIYHFFNITGSEPPADTLLSPAQRARENSKKKATGKGSRKRETTTTMTEDDFAEMFF